MDIEPAHVREPEKDHETPRVHQVVDRGPEATELPKLVQRQTGGHAWHGVVVPIDEVKHNFAGNGRDKVQDLEAREEIQQQHYLRTLRCERKIQPES